MKRSGTNKRRIIIFVLVFAVSLLAWLIYLQIQKEQRGAETLFNDEIGNVMNTISIQLPEQPEIKMHAEGADWKMTAPFTADVSTKSLQHLTTLLAEPIQAIYQSEGKDLSDFGLDDSAIRVRFNGVEYMLGSLNPINHHRYVLQGKRILMVNEVVYELLSRGVNGFTEE